MMTLFDPTSLATFALASAALIATPGPGQALVLARTLQGGTRAGVLTAAGLELGTAVHILAAALGLSAVLATSATAFAAVKYLGAAYLVVLGVLILRKREAPTHHSTPQPPRPTRHLLAHAAATGLLNPKVALFFLAFLPQFVDPARGQTFLQFVLLGSGFAILGFIGDSTVALLAGQARNHLLGDAGSPWRERLTGGILIGLGVRLVFITRP